MVQGSEVAWKKLEGAKRPDKSHPRHAPSFEPNFFTNFLNPRPPRWGALYNRRDEDAAAFAVLALMSLGACRRTHSFCHRFARSPPPPPLQRCVSSHKAFFQKAFRVVCLRVRVYTGLQTGL